MITKLDDEILEKNLPIIKIMYFGTFLPNKKEIDRLNKLRKSCKL